mmetsp:Transcript_23447/g.42313  ORF Transcript_23447/g.42313 Transcript_23447/m.42313 type:complete len:430 (+) Transcript_23447:68-1357(+)|eukprot:CAMPEP_0197634166 /NCGR_PEP_ID=MMETSP1338-20131121/10343_1 /TAXON_ID=43686 ORGANISM="Pelagodinium beii, Strain RCC1491" /NCGR_SAMPLE_ID=MMETSP1338 /ASSEMBLY_ACC=CAM_ASM_000754 /LENGTH=429 /DNA_ID=CAMNT_0043205983 /DNA_START=68 /DNA_END=1357 /DNA_ORIENTATION=-
MAFVFFFLLLAPGIVSTRSHSVLSSAQAVHKFGVKHAHISWSARQETQKDTKRHLREQLLSTDDELQRNDQLKIMHITDAHVSLTDEDPPHTHRMYTAMLEVKDVVTNQQMHPKDQLAGLFKKAKAENVDLIALGGDILNFPSKSHVDWLLAQLKEHAPGVPFVYTAGNHDWHRENVDEASYDASRKRELLSTLRPLFEQSAASSEDDDGPFSGFTYGHLRQKGVDVLFLDNSNYQIDSEQLAFAQKHFSKDVNEHGPLLLLLHMPLFLDGVDLEPKEVCGHPAWGASTDNLAECEGRPKWPEEGNLNSTMAFLELVKTHTAPAGRVVAIMTGHVHKDFSNKVATGTPQTSLACSADAKGCSLLENWQVQDNAAGEAVQLTSLGAQPGLYTSSANGALQYSTLDAAEGGFRMLTVQRGEPDTPVINKII